jgi:formate-dependent nitrite reductase membrane component NrfD
MLLFAMLFLAEWTSATSMLSLITGVLATVFTAITTALLVFDLERPERFLRIIFRPQWKSWLTRGAFILIGFSLLSTAWAGYVLLVRNGIVNAVPGFENAVVILSIPFALGTAAYTAFLFGQAEGRDLWQSALLPVHLIIQAIMAGAAILVIANEILPLATYSSIIIRAVLGALIAIDLVTILAGEFAMPHASEVAARAAKMISHGRYARLFWGGAILVGHIIPIALLIVPGTVTTIVAALLVLGGLYAYEFAFVMAPQRIPNS